MINGANPVSTSAALAVAAALFVTPVAAQDGWPQPDSEIARAPFQIYLSTDCTGSPCMLDFPQVPANSRLDISNVSCVLEAPATAGTLHVVQLHVLDVNGNFIAGATLAPILTRDAAFRIWAANHSIFLYAPTGWYFRVSVLHAGIRFMACHISGHLVRIA
jgi:hypothetical protein